MAVLNNTSSPAIRTGIQAAVAEGAIRLIEVVPDPDLEISLGDRTIMLIVATGLVSLAQNFIENRMGKAILVPQRTDPPMPEAADDTPTRIVQAPRVQNREVIPEPAFVPEEPEQT
jgi:hypothetical protein